MGSGPFTRPIAPLPIRHMLNLESVITYKGTETVHQLSLGRELTGFSTF